MGQHKSTKRTVPVEPRVGQVSDHRRGPIGGSARPATQKLAISFDGRLASDVRRAAKAEADGNVSAWLAKAARDRLRLEAGLRALAEFEAEYGPITDEELRRVNETWPKA